MAEGELKSTANSPGPTTRQQGVPQAKKGDPVKNQSGHGKERAARARQAASE